MFLSVILTVVSLACSLSMESVTTVSPTTTVAPSPMTTVTATSQRAQVTAFEAVNIRKNATVYSDDVGDLYRGAIVYVLECKDGWARIATGWVNGYYLGGVCR